MLVHKVILNGEYQEYYGQWTGTVYCVGVKNVQYNFFGDKVWC